MILSFGGILIPPKHKTITQEQCQRALGAAWKSKIACKIKEMPQPRFTGTRRAPSHPPRNNPHERRFFGPKVTRMKDRRNTIHGRF